MAEWVDLRRVQMLCRLGFEVGVQKQTHRHDDHIANDWLCGFKKGLPLWLRSFHGAKDRGAESIAIAGMLSQLTQLETPPIEFDEKLWHAVVECVTVYNDDRLVYSLKDGSEITLML